jgi:hypothetical protein
MNKETVSTQLKIHYEQYETPVTSVIYLNDEVEAAVETVLPRTLQAIVLLYITPQWQKEELVCDQWNMTNPTLNSLLNQKLVHAIDHELLYDVNGVRACITIHLKQKITFPGRTPGVKPKRMAYKIITPYTQWTLPFQGPANAVVSQMFYQLSNGSMFYCLHSPTNDYGHHFRYVLI